jgi:hypothetical protein
MNKIGPEELKQLPFIRGATFNAPVIPFSQDTLRAHEKTHILIYTPNVPITLVRMREIFGTDPSKSEPCMYGQDWYLKEEFANQTLDGAWHLIPKMVREDARGKQPDDVEKALDHEQFPTAITLAFTFFAWRLLMNETLWKHDFLWCRDRDHQGDRIYVGRYEDPEGINKNGFNIHRHLSLRAGYSAAPEVVS